MIGFASSDIKAIENIHANPNSILLYIAGNSSVYVEAKQTALALQIVAGNKVQMRIDVDVGIVEWVLVDPFLVIARVSIPAALKVK